jgi:hypothetical protein
VIRFTFAGDKIAHLDVIGEPATLGQVALAVLA